MSKNLLRKKFIKIRKKNYRVVDINYKFLKKIIKKNCISSNPIIGCYYPINSEMDCLEILKRFESENFKISLPAIKPDNKMDFLKWTHNQPLEVGKMGIPIPKNTQEIIPDIILVPLVAFDNKKNRLGYGGGFYDRYIRKIRETKKILTIGLAFSFQKVKKLNINKFDQKLDYIITES